MPWYTGGDSDVIMDDILGAVASPITSITIVYSAVYSRTDQENIKYLRHWLLCGVSPVSGDFPAQMPSYAENVSIWWRQRALFSLIKRGYLDMS